MHCAPSSTPPALDRAALPAAGSALLERIETGTARVAVIGLGYVGLPLVHALHRGGLEVVGLDIDQSKIDHIERGESYIRHLPDELIASLTASPRFAVSTDFDRLRDVDVSIVCVPTPLGPHREPDLSYVVETARAIGARAKPGQLVVLESTTYPRTTRDEFLPAILESHRGEEPLRVGDNFFVAYSPEREDPGRKDHDTQSIPKLVGGLDPASTLIATTMYRRGVSQVIEVSSAEIAEAAKILENVFRSVNIALANEMKTILSAMDIDVWEVIRAASTKPFGFMPFYPGPGLGGHCIPIDPFYLAWKAREVQRPTRFIELAGEINTAMPRYVVSKLTHALNDAGKAASGSRVLVIGIAYKPDVDDTRESPAFELIELLHELNASVDYHDPYVARTPLKRAYDLSMESVALNAETVASYDAVLIATNHASIDYAMLAEHARIIVDTRDAMRPQAGAIRGRWVKA